MPTETRFVAHQAPRATGQPRVAIANQPGATSGWVTANPSAGRAVHDQAAVARAAAAAPPAAPGGFGPARPPGSRPQDARVEFVPRPQRGGAGIGNPQLATNAPATVTILPRAQPAGQVYAQVPPGGGVAFALDEATLVAYLLDQYVRANPGPESLQNVALAQGALAKVTANAQALLALMTPPAPAPAGAPRPTRVQVPMAGTNPPAPAPAPPAVTHAWGGFPPGAPNAWPSQSVVAAWPTAPAPDATYTAPDAGHAGAAEDASGAPGGP